MVASKDYVQRIVSACDAAAEANLRTPGRLGNVVALGRAIADEVMLTGDLHGNRRNFNLIRLTAALDEHPGRHLVLQEVCHGGPSYPRNGGCQSHTLLEDVIALKTKHPNQVHFIPGNHELAELTGYPIQKNRQLLNVQFRLGLEQMYGAAFDAVHAAYRRFIRSCPLAVRLSQGVFVSHSIPDRIIERGFSASVFSRPLTDEDYIEDGDVFRLVWGRDYREQNARKFAELVESSIVVNGHEPCFQGLVAPNGIQIILDCSSPRGAYVILPVGDELTHAEIMDRVCWLD